MASLNIPNFDWDDQTTISTRWEKYNKRFENLCVALNVEEEKQKLALFLNYVGEEVYDIYDNLSGNAENFAEAVAVYTHTSTRRKTLNSKFTHLENWGRTPEKQHINTTYVLNNKQIDANLEKT